MMVILGLILTAVGLVGCYMLGEWWWLAATFCGVGTMLISPNRLQYRWVRRLAAWIRRRAVELVTVVGMVLIAGGVSWIYPPAGLIVGGAMLVGDAYVARRIMTTRGRRGRR